MAHKIKTSVEIDGTLTTGEYGTSTGHILLDTTPTNAPTSVGALFWDAENRTLAVNDGVGNTTLQVGQEERTLIHNGTGVALTDGQVVYITGSTGELPSVALASNTSEETSNAVLGVVTESIANGANGFITSAGVVHGLNTLSFNEGDVLWLGSTPGTFTNIKPISPNHLVLIGYVVKKAGGNGSIIVKIQNTQELDECSDVLFGTLANNDLLVYETATGLWKNKTASSINLISGTGTTNTLPKFTGTSTLGNSNLSDNGTIVTSTTDMLVNGLTVGRGGGNHGSNVAVGSEALASTSTSIVATYNVAVGSYSMYSNSTGAYNIGIGESAMYSNISGELNVAVGVTSLASSLGSNNTALGANALEHIGTGNSNVAVGHNAGRYNFNTTQYLISASDSIFIGATSKALGTSSTNEIVIGANTSGLGSNSTVLGNASTTKTGIYGRLQLSNNSTLPTDDGVSALNINGGVKLNTSPTTSAGSYEILTRNTSTGVVEKVASSAYSPSTGGTGYIQNQNSSAQSANMWISGFVRANNAQISSWSISSEYARFGHENFNGASNYGFLQRNTGSLHLAGASIAFSGAATFSSTVTASNFISNDNINGYNIEANKTGGYGSSLALKNSSTLSNALIRFFKPNNTDFYNLYTSSTGIELNGTIAASNGTLLGGTLTSGYVPKATGANSLGNSLIYDNGTNVGIGTTSTSGKLHIQDTNGGVFFDGSGATYNRFKSTTSSASVGRDLLFSTQNSGTTPDLYINSVGNVGIGTTSPLHRLHVNASGANNVFGLYNVSNVKMLEVNTSSGSPTLSMYKADGTSIGVFLNATANSYFNGGNVLIGTTTDDGYNKLQVNGTVSSGNTTLGTSQPTANNQLTRKDYVDTALALKANLASPTFTGTPTAPTATEGTNTTQVATTAFVQSGFVPQIKITTTTSITTATVGSVTSLGQQGRNVVIDNGSNVINLTVNGTDGFCASYLKHGTGNITFVQGSGRTLVQVDGTAVLSGAVGSTATISSVGTTDYLMISNK